MSRRPAGRGPRLATAPAKSTAVGQASTALDREREVCLHYARRYKAVTLGRSAEYRGDNQQMMPSRARLASATAAGVVGLAVAGLILFGTDPLGTGTTVTAVPAPAAASGAATDTGTEPFDEAAETANRRPKPTGTVGGTPRSTYKPASRTAAAQ